MNDLAVNPQWGLSLSCSSPPPQMEQLTQTTSEGFCRADIQTPESLEFSDPVIYYRHRAPNSGWHLGCPGGPTPASSLSQPRAGCGQLEAVAPIGASLVFLRAQAGCSEVVGTCRGQRRF